LFQTDAKGSPGRLAPPAIAFVGKGRERGPLIGRQASPHAQQHDGTRLVQFGPGRLDDLDVLQDGGVITVLDQTIEFIFRPVEGPHPLAERRQGFLEDLLETRTLLGGQTEFTPEPLVLPPFATLGQGRSDAEGDQRDHSRGADEQS